MKKSKIKIGQKVGRLTVMNKDEEGSKPKLTKNGNVFVKLKYFCQCDCGNIVSVRSDNLLASGDTKSRTRSCGCIQKEAAARNGRLSKLPFSVKPFNEIFYNYKRNAKLRGYSFELSENIFKELTQRPCFYCGKINSNRQNNTKVPSDFFLYNGIDRVDNDKGYISGNCVPCCRYCNYSKADRCQEEFINENKKIFFHTSWKYLTDEEKLSLQKLLYVDVKE